MSRFRPIGRRTLATLAFCTAIALLAAESAVACGPYGALKYNIAIWNYLQAAEKPSEEFNAEEVVTKIREGGPAALETLFTMRDQMLRRQVIDEPKLARLEELIDQVGGQKYCTESRLYWYTDLDAARAAAEKSGKPILSLRMLGKLTEEYSCANSRFFRTTLYANEAISRTLRERFVLHWKSVRPVPRVTVDFGDGRKLERTLTGNSAHYVLSAEGRPLDVLPGLYGPQAFGEWLERSETLFTEYGAAEEDARETLLRDYHAARRDAVTAEWVSDLQQVQPGLAARAALGPNAVVAAPAGNPPAEAAAAIAQPKKISEFHLIRAVTLRPEALAAATDDATWRAIAGLHADDAKLDEASVALIERQHPDAAKAGAVAITKMRVESPLVRLVRRFESSVALDTVRNEYDLHRRAHAWFAEGAAPVDVEALNDRVYAELFLTPGDDPWLGLVQPETYTALANDGIVREAK